MNDNFFSALMIIFGLWMLTIAALLFTLTIG